MALQKTKWFPRKTSDVRKNIDHSPRISRSNFLHPPPPSIPIHFCCSDTWQQKANAFPHMTERIKLKSEQNIQKDAIASFLLQSSKWNERWGRDQRPPRSIPLYFLWPFSDTFRRTKSACKPFLLFSIKSTEPRAIFLFIHFYPKVESNVLVSAFFTPFLSIYI